MFAEKVSGAKTDRVQLTRFLKALTPGDQLVVTRLDRLARSTRDLLNILDQIGKAGATFKSLADAKEDEAFIVGGNPASVAAIVYRAHCISANSR